MHQLLDCGTLANQVRLMKTLCTMLIALLFVHLQCGGSCLAESLRLETLGPTSAEPPCHQHGPTPTNDQPTHHAEGTEGTCTQGPLIEAKLSIAKVVLQWEATFPDAIGTSQPSDLEIHRYIPADARILLRPAAAISVLRV